MSFEKNVDEKRKEKRGQRKEKRGQSRVALI
jgi:hypothetical protein